MDIDRIAGDLGVTVRTGRVPDGWWGSYSHMKHEITLRPRLGAIQRRSSLAHELGHAYYMHKRSTPQAEREASLWAARHLIKLPEFIDACQLQDTAQGIAHILGVLPRDVSNYTITLTSQDLAQITQALNPGEP